MRKIFITGASGFFGQSVISALEQRNFPFQAICFYYSKKPQATDDRFSWIQCDLLDHYTHKNLMNTHKPTDLIHLAWDVPPGEFWHSMKNIDWLYASISLFKEFCDGGGKKFIGAGSSTEYDWFSGVLDEQTTPLIPSTLYGECKKSLHAILQQIQQRNYEQTVLIWARVGYFFGEQEPQQKLISKIINHLMIQTSLNLVSEIISRPYAHVKYLGEAFVHVLFNRGKNIDFNLSGSDQYTVKEIVEFIGRELQKSTNVISYGAYKSPIKEPDNLIFNTDRLKNIIGYDMPTTFYEDLKEMILEKRNSDIT